MEKIKIKKEVLFIRKYQEIKWSDIKHFEFEDDDVIQIGYEGPHYNQNESNSEFFFATVYRQIEETDEQFNERIKLWEKCVKEETDEQFKEQGKNPEEIFRSVDGFGYNLLRFNIT